MNRQIRELQEEINRQSEIDNGLKLELGKMCRQVEDEERKTREYMGGRMDEWERKLSDKGIEILEIKKRIHSLAMG
jgi:predicted RNase H-like nuclease (RuvC/YqgF family)